VGRTGRARRKKLTNILLEELWLHSGKYPAWGTSPEWDEVLEDKELLEYIEMFHCLPSELDGEDYHLLQRLRRIRAAELSYLKADREAKAQRSPRGR
jgi:hypothetical protein